MTDTSSRYGVRPGQLWSWQGIGEPYTVLVLSRMVEPERADRGLDEKWLTQLVSIHPRLDDAVSCIGSMYWPDPRFILLQDVPS